MIARRQRVPDRAGANAMPAEIAASPARRRTEAP
jgi:hypothetical protein